MSLVSMMPRHITCSDHLGKCDSFSLLYPLLPVIPTAPSLKLRLVCAQSLSCVQLFATSWSPPGSSVHGILQARILGWVAVLFSSGPSEPQDRTCVSCIGRRGLPLSHQGCLNLSLGILLLSRGGSPVVVMQPVRSSRKEVPLAECFISQSQRFTRLLAAQWSGRERRKTADPLMGSITDTDLPGAAGPAEVRFELRVKEDNLKG